MTELPHCLFTQVYKWGHGHILGVTLWWTRASYKGRSSNAPGSFTLPLQPNEPREHNNQSKSLGLTIDENLSWKAHIYDIFKQVSSGIGALKWARQFVLMHTAIKIYNGLIEPHVDYWSSVWDSLTQQLSEKLQKTSETCYDTSSRYLLNSLWDNLSVRRVKQKASLKYKCINNLAPAYLCNFFFFFAPRTPNYYFRNAKRKSMLSKLTTDYLNYGGALLWNNLPE